MDTFKVIKSTQTSNGNYCTKLQTETKVEQQTPFGLTIQKRQVTYYLFLDQAAPVGMEAPLDLSMFDIVIKDTSIETEDGKKTVSLKYLYPKG